MLATSDGKLNHRIISPKKKLPKVYLVFLDKSINADVCAHLAAGVVLDDGYHTLPAQVLLIDTKSILLTLYEGKFHQVKRMLKAV